MTALKVLAILYTIEGVLGLLLVCTMLKVAKRPVGIAALILLGISGPNGIKKLLLQPKLQFVDISPFDCRIAAPVLGLGAFCNLVAVAILTKHMCIRPYEPEAVITLTSEKI
ncbi:hypothetical protein DPMN_121535 [Dreissena polymorpha]|uniref:Uncharacterized protein n=1 Tax=Dreissena polymorpha TaxID=45954 RepID=A0A9D4GQR1_DREPO|nr:hypothetical protein DPMN_121535 [Dreissena polymorpha]